MISPVEDWTVAKFKSFIVSALRGAFRRYPPKQQCIEQAYTKTKINKKSNRKAKHYKCAHCKQEFPRAEVQADHIVPIVDPKKGFVDWNTWIERAFVGKECFQCLCLECHKIKSMEERKK